MKTLRTKPCATCRKPRPLECFAPSAQTRDGLKSQCRDCASDSFRAWKERRLAMCPRLTIWRVPGIRTVRRVAVTSARAAGERVREDSLT